MEKQDFYSFPHIEMSADASPIVHGLIMPTEPDHTARDRHHFRFYLPHFHLNSLFGDDWIALRAEAFARFFGTPFFLVGQTFFVAGWIILNVVGVFKFDLYPFILLNLAFSLQAAYAAPLILLAQTRQSDRDKVHSEADALHREALAAENSARAAQILELMQQNTAITELTRELSQKIQVLTAEIHRKMITSSE